MPILWRHIWLSETKHIKNFNAAIKLNPKLGDLIQGITLLDDMLSMVPLIYADEIIETDDQNDPWVKHWMTLIWYMGILSRKHRLSTIVLSREACKRLTYAKLASRGEFQPLSEPLKRSKIQVDHLVVSHANLGFILTHIEARRLTYYSCDLPMAAGALDTSEWTLLRSEDLQAVSIMMGDNYNHLGGLKPCRGEGKNEAQVDRLWMDSFIEQIKKLCGRQTKWSKVTINFHKETQESKKQLQDKFSALVHPVEIGVWGRSSDKSQMMAEMEDFDRHGWVEKEPWYRTKHHDDEDDMTGGWCIGLPPVTQWCGCVDLHEDEDGEEGDWDDEDDYGLGFDPNVEDGWSDDSAHWNPMQRLAFASGESYHYNQDYLDRYAL